jgi:hypothetical protein
VRETIGIIAGECEYEMGTLMTVALASILRERGYATRYLDGVQSSHELKALRTDNVVAIISFNGVLANLGRTSEAPSIWDEARMPFIAWLVDHPIYHLWRLDWASDLLIPTCIDETHARFLREWGLNTRSRELHHFALGNPEQERRGDRDIDVLFPASVHDPDELRVEWGRLAQPLRRLLEESTAECLAHPEQELVQIIARLCPEVGIFDPGSIGAAVGYAFVRADQYVRARQRTVLLDALADVGIVVDHVGSGDGARGALRRHRTHGSVSATTLLTWLGRARVVVHGGTNFAAGSHERVFTSQAQGAAVVTEANVYWRDLLSDGHNALLFEWDELEAMPERLKKIISRPEETARIAEAGRTVARTSIVRAGDEAVTAVEASQRLLAVAG